MCKEYETALEDVLNSLIELKRTLENAGCFEGADYVALAIYEVNRVGKDNVIGYY